MKLIKAIISNIEARVYLLATCLILGVTAIFSPRICLAALSAIRVKVHSHE
jgi:hypothetical protein